MKRILPFLLSLLLLCACVQKPQTANGLVPESADVHPVELGFDVPEIGNFSDFACTLSAALLDGAENRNLSPVSVYFALAMAAEGANGKTQADLLKLLGCSDLEALHGNAGKILKQLSKKDWTGEIMLSNALWMAEAFPLKEAYQKQLKTLYGADAESVRFGTADAGKRISDRISEKTNGLIAPSPDAMQFDETTLAVLLNTVYFCDLWAEEFKDKDVQTGTFTRADGTEQSADYLHRFESWDWIYKGDGFLRYTVWFESRGVMTFILPDEGIALSDLLGTPEKLKTLLYGGDQIRADVDLLLPKFAFSDKFELADVLCALGIADAFTKGRADFSGMTDIPARLDRVIQETAIDLNERGVIAAAYTYENMEPAAEPWFEEVPRIDFHLDRPFLFVIKDRSGTPLFVGTVNAPTEQQ